MPTLDRRSFVAVLPTLAGGAALLGMTRCALAAPRGEGSQSFPKQDPALVKEIVTVSHFDVARVGALLKQAPQLANASYDLGFGDWETPLGAAAHTGGTEIAALLLQHGARPDIFAFAMLGKTDVVRAMITALPGIQRHRGPHGLTLLHHARAGGAEAQDVVDYLTTLGDADTPYANAPLSEAEKAVYVGQYVGKDSADDIQIEVLLAKKTGALMLRRGEGFGQRLFNQGDHAFIPAGAEDVRVMFTVAEGGNATGLVVTTPAELLTAVRA